MEPERVWICCRAVEADPLNAAAYNGLGLVAEARSSYAEASEAYGLAVQLASSASGVSPFSRVPVRLSMSVTPSHGLRKHHMCRFCDVCLDRRSSLTDGQDAISISTTDQRGHTSPGVSAKLNMARLLSNWQPGRAVELYDQLLSKGHGSSCPETMLAFGHALAGSDQTPRAAEVLHTAAQVASTPEVCDVTP